MFPWTQSNSHNVLRYFNSFQNQQWLFEHQSHILRVTFFSTNFQFVAFCFQKWTKMKTENEAGDLWRQQIVCSPLNVRVVCHLYAALLHTPCSICLLSLWKSKFSHSVMQNDEKFSLVRKSEQSNEFTTSQIVLGGLGLCPFIGLPPCHFVSS